MHLINTTQQCLINLRYNKLRSFLALLGVLVGTASVVAMVLGGKLATDEALKQFKTLGTDLIAVNIDYAKFMNSNSNSDDITLPEAYNLKNVDKNIIIAAPYTLVFHPIYFRQIKLDSIVFGATAEFAKVMHIELAQGRFLSVADQLNHICVIGNSLYQTIYEKTHTNPLGQQLRIGNDLFTIAGIAKPWPENNFVYANINTAVLIPVQTAKLINHYASINNLILKLQPNTNIPGLEKNIDSYAHKIWPGKQIAYRSAKNLVEKMRKQSEILTVFLGLIASVSLLVGGIGVMNIMLVSVIERKREIGIRLAIGASNFDISIMFLIESTLLASIGGMMGVILGTSIAYTLATIKHWEFTLYSLPLIAGFLISALVGIFFGFYPAYRASKLNPIDALRAD